MGEPTEKSKEEKIDKPIDEFAGGPGACSYQEYSHRQQHQEHQHHQQNQEHHQEQHQNKDHQEQHQEHQHHQQNQEQEQQRVMGAARPHQIDDGSITDPWMLEKVAEYIRTTSDDELPKLKNTDGLVHKNLVRDMLFCEYVYRGLYGDVLTYFNLLQSYSSTGKSKCIWLSKEMRSPYYGNISMFSLVKMTKIKTWEEYNNRKKLFDLLLKYCVVDE